MKTVKTLPTARALAGFGLLALTLAACNTPIVPTVAAVTVTGPGSNALKIGTPTTFSAVALDANGTTLEGKTVQWASSDDKIARVDANGVVTPKKFGKVKITATVDDKPGSSAELNVYGFRMACGTLQYTVAATKLGTAFLFEIVAPDGKAPQADATISLNGPSGWKLGSQNYGYSAQSNFEDFLLEIPAMAGTYKATTTLGGEKLEATCAITDLQQMLPPAAINLGSKTGEMVSASWVAVSGASSYQAQVKGSPFGVDNTVFSEPSKGSIPYQSALAADVYAKSSFGLSVDHVLLVKAYSADLSQTLPDLPAQFNASVSVSNPFKVSP